MIGNVIQIIHLGVSIAIIVLLAIIYNDTENDPLKIYKLEISSDFLENTDTLISGGGGSNSAKMSRKGPHAEDIEFNKTLSYYNIKKESSIDLNLKLNTVRSDMRNMEKKYQSEISTLKSNFAKEREIYNNKILKLSEFNPVNLQKNIEYKIENKYKQQLLSLHKEHFLSQLFCSLLSKL